MALTVLMFAVLIVSYALMFGLVKFTENIIATPEAVAADSSVAGDGDARIAMIGPESPPGTPRR